MSTSQDHISNSPETPDSSPTCKQDLQVPSKDDLVAWLHVKLAEAEQSVRARLGMIEGFQRRNDPKFWEELKKLPGVFTTRSRQKAPTEAELQKEEASQRRILRKCEREVTMFKALIALVHPDVYTSPRIMTAQGKEWWVHDGSDECPCDPEMMVDLLYWDRPEPTINKGLIAQKVIWQSEGFSKNLHIIAWRPADAPDILPRQGGAECL